jgi:trehalose/maltose transport system substrate-binding protein
VNGAISQALPRPTAPTIFKARVREGAIPPSSNSLPFGASLRRIWPRLALLLLGLSFSLNATAETISIACSALGRELELCRAGAQAWARATGNEVRLVPVPNSASERLALFQQILAAHATDIDVFQLDVVWSGILAAHLIDLAPFARDSVQQHLPAILAGGMAHGKLVALPWYADVGVLYYRKDLLEKHNAGVPQTWSQLTETARRIQALERASGNTRLWGFVWQGRAYEGLTCDALEWIASRGGGSIVGVDGKPQADNAAARAALTDAAGWIDDISPPGVLNYAEEEARALFQSGNAIFMRNWPYAWALANAPDSPVRGQVGIVALPRGDSGGVHVGTLGGGQLSVSRYSPRAAAAAWLVVYLTSPAEQKRRALAGGYNPTIAHLYTDADVLAANPYFAKLQPLIEQAVARPSGSVGTRYNQVSTKIWSAVHRALAHQQSAEEALTDLQRDLERLRRVGRW